MQRIRGMLWLCFGLVILGLMFLSLLVLTGVDRVLDAGARCFNWIGDHADDFE
jgi:hypothetical protein